MTKKKASEDANKEKLMLKVSIEEASAKLQKRLEKGRKFIPLTTVSMSDFNHIKKQFYKWDSYNNELLKQLFTTDEMSEEYSWSPGAFLVTLGKESLNEKKHSLSNDINSKVDRIDSIIDRLELIPVLNELRNKKGDTSSNISDKDKVFIVHGHDDAAKYEVARFIEKIGYEPIILHEQVSASQTIIEKIESHSNVGFGVVIYSPCDIGSVNLDTPIYNFRARQNVVFEHGFLIGKLGRSNVCPLVKGDVETPGDISGIVYTSMDQGDWRLILAKELKNAGYVIDMNKVV